MTTSCRSCWRNCALHADSEMLDIDGMEDHLAPVGPNVSRVRELISSLELCHHKADRWVHNIVEAIGTGETQKGLGTRSPDRHHPAETVWQDACASLSAWCAGRPASRLLARLGDRSPLKEWQVQRVVEKIRSAIHWPRSRDDPTAQYVWMLLRGGEYDVAYHTRCPEHYEEYEEFWLTTVRTVIHDTDDGEEADLSLGLAIDMLMPCHWRFVENLEVVLGAIGGTLTPAKPFAACGRNIGLLPTRRRMEVVSNTLRSFCNDARPGQEFDSDLLTLLGQPTDVKRWLAASLDKTIRLQLDPPAEVRAMSALTGPEWIRE